MSRHIFDLQEKEYNTPVHNEQYISDEEQHQIDEYEAREYDKLDYIRNLIEKEDGYYSRDPTDDRK
jgi:hypothetical protein